MTREEFDIITNKIGCWFTHLKLNSFRKTFDGEVYPSSALGTDYDLFIHKLEKELSFKDKSSLPSNLDEEAKRIAYDVCKQLPNGEEKDGIVYYAILAAIAGAEWMAGQGFPRWRNIDEDKPKQGEDCACITVTVNGRIKYSNFEEGPWSWSEKIDDELLGETEAFIGHNFYGDKEYHTCSHWMPWDEFMGALERMLKK